MIPVESLLYKLDQQLNKLSSNDHQSIPLEDKIIVVNQAQLILIKQKLDSNNVLGLGFDAFKKRYEDLQSLVENYDAHPLDLVLTDERLNKYVAKLEGIKPAYMFYIDCYITADKGKCKDRIVYVNNDLVKHSDTTTLLTNSNYKPSFEYQETFPMISTDEIGIFTDGTFIPTKLYVSYLRYPKYIDYPGYTKLDGTESVKQDCELKNYLEDELLDIAVQSLALSTENPNAAQASAIRKKESE